MKKIPSENWMSHPVLTIDQDALLSEAHKKMKGHKSRHLIVLGLQGVGDLDAIIETFIEAQIVLLHA